MKKISGLQIIDAIQWIVIVVLLIACVLIGRKNRQISHDISAKYDNSYVKIYDSQPFSSLKKENKMLYDSIKKLNNVESVVQIKYVKRYVSDTIKVNVPDTFLTHNDSVYHYENNSDSIKYKLDISANKIYWHKLDFQVNDELMLITKEEDGKVETNISANHGDVEGGLMWHRKNKTWKDRIKIGPTVGVGYGLVNKKFDTFVGVGVTIDLW